MLPASPPARKPARAAASGLVSPAGAAILGAHADRRQPGARVSRFVRRALVGVALGVLVYAVAVLWVDAGRVQEAMSEYTWSMVLAALALSSVNYLLRFLKWELCLGWLGVRGVGPGAAPGLGYGRSLLVYLAGLSMSVTPGKIGEVLRSYLLRETDGVPFTRTAPVVVADRLTDLVALVVLSLVGIAEHREYLPVALVTLALVFAGVVVLGSPRLCRGLLTLLGRLPRLRGLVARAEGLVDSSAAVLRLRALVVLSAISVVGWGLECVGYWLILHGFAGVEASLSLCTFLWATTTLIGALSFLPGGLGATEGSLAVLVARLAHGVTQPIALASTILIRACTLWYGEVVGGVALAVLIRRGSITPEASAGNDGEAVAPAATR
ncbi:lysylphosphatidylglycerol synthase transmembrane domain-containing protein [Nannocystis sp. SCPEA4]|uniref:lysylphosphatidylglycerol synthase transmembrane domain-containing protein n=1 Tax=Nannocystis sp. SCPEA4 TaxID=2996787 RepID=UPI002270F0D7|nr:lysylphosphatidylglycerol synthase transmembrane domain-containing protein [Nannocystis sp. SCPEA4]MCY1062002.1 lysylphosphatidylglycerol synthase transmembrane domain-containing protein [Nannocystis sp. SCPEA4]